LRLSGQSEMFLLTEPAENDTNSSIDGTDPVPGYSF